MRERHILRAWPLTPIHVGTGEQLTPESYALDGNALRTFNGFAALSAASAAQRGQYRNLLKGGDFVRAQAHLAKLAGASGQPIVVGDETLADVDRVLRGRSPGKAAIRPFMRDGEAVILPGSSLKGAFRTAWIDQAATKMSIPQPGNPRHTKDDARDLNDTALGITDHAALEQDPFRDVAVVDARIPPGRTRYDRATLGKLDGDRPRLKDDETRGIQMNVERLTSLADGGTLEHFAVEIDIAAADFVRKRKDHDKRGRVPGATPTAAALWSAANRFHADLWRHERGRFYGDGPSALLLDRLLAAFGLTGAADLAGQLTARGLVLLRIGRYAQFESKAVRINGCRYGVKAAQRGKQAAFIKAGGTRTTVAVRGIAVPFGWLILALPEKGPAGNPVVDLNGLAARPSPAGGEAPRPRPGPSAPAAGAPALAGQFRFRNGDRVRHPTHGDALVVGDVPRNATGIDVDFGEGDSPEHYPVEGWTKR